VQPACPSTNGLPRSFQFSRYRVDAFGVSQHFSKNTFIPLRPGAIVFLPLGLYRARRSSRNIRGR
jgi:hypothetical protein